MNDEKSRIEVCLRHIFQIIREADTSTIHYSLFTFHYPPAGMGIKNPHPWRNQGWDTSRSHIPRFHPGYGRRPSLIDALTGAPGAEFPHTRLRSGIISGRGTKFFHQNEFLSENLSENACLRHSLSDRLNLSQFHPIVNPFYRFIGENFRKTGQNPVYPNDNNNYVFM